MSGASMPIQLLCCTLKWDHLLRKDLRDFSPKVMAKKKKKIGSLVQKKIERNIVL